MANKKVKKTDETENGVPPGTYTDADDIMIEHEGLEAWEQLREAAKRNQAKPEKEKK